MHVEISEYQVQKMNVNQPKQKLQKENLCMVQKNHRWKNLTYLKEKNLIYAGGAGMENREDTPMDSFTKTAYCMPLVHNSKSLEKTTNTSFKYPRVQPVAKNEAYFVLVKHNF